MAKVTFLFKQMRRVFIVEPETQVMVVSEGGPKVVKTPSKKIEVNNGTYETEDPKIIERLRSDPQYGSEITEFTEADQRATKIRLKKQLEAEEEIKKAEAEEAKKPAK